MKIKNLLKKTTPTLWGLLILSLAVMLHAQNGKYEFNVDLTSSRYNPSFYKFDTRTGAGFICGMQTDKCTPLNKKGLKKYLELLDKLRLSGH